MSSVLAFDRSVRSLDADGRLHVAVASITRAGVNPYWGSEVVGGAALGLNPSRVYQLFRPPDELAAAASTFNNLPLLSQHVPVSASDHRPDLVVGSTGSDAQWSDPYVRCSLVVWAQEAIDHVEDGTQRQLSAAYRYRPVVERGNFRGRPYDIRMTGIQGSHVALVEAGRAGADVMVGDAMPQSFIGRKAMSGAQTTVDPVIDPDDDVLTNLTKFLQDKLSPDDLAMVMQIMGLADPAILQAQDHARRVARVNDQRSRAMYLSRFPNANRLGWSR